MRSLDSASKLKAWLPLLKAWDLDGIVLYGAHRYLPASRKTVDRLRELRAGLPGLSVYVAGENAEFFRALAADTGWSASIDGFHYEFEYWNFAQYRYASRADAFARALDDLGGIRALADERNQPLEMYLGWFDAAEADLLLPLLDRVLLHAYVREAGAVLPYAADRIRLVSARKRPLDWRILLSAEGDFMGDILKAKGQEAVEAEVVAALEGTAGFAGVHWFTAELVRTAAR